MCLCKKIYISKNVNEVGKKEGHFILLTEVYHSLHIYTILDIHTNVTDYMPNF